MRLARILACATALTAAVMVAPQPVGASPACPVVDVSRWQAARTPLLGWSENVTFDADGNLWVSRGQRNTVERYGRSGVRTASVSVTAPGSVRVGPDGMLYVASGNTTTNMLPGPRTGTIVRLDPLVAQPKSHIFATGLGMPNGIAFGSDRQLYVADSRLGVLRLTPTGRIDAAWSARAPKSQSPNATVNGFGLNGIAASGDDLFVTLTSSVTGRVLRVPIADPARTSVAADLTAPLPGLLDDLLAPRPGTLVVTTVTGQVRSVNLRTRATCTVDVGQPVTALAADPRRVGRMIAGTESGDLLELRIR